LIQNKKKRADFNSPWFTFDEIKEMLKDIICGLSYLHQQKISHRDLKPENILVTLKGISSIQSLHITDFGVSRVFGEETLLASTVGTGTLIYMAPEVANEESHRYDPFKSDIFSFGVLCYVIFVGDVPKRTVKMISNGKIPDLPNSLLNDTKFKQIVEMYQKCIVEDSDKRPSAEFLQQYLNIF